MGGRVGYNRGEMCNKVAMLTAVGPEVGPIAGYARKVEEAGWDGISLYDSQNLTANVDVGRGLYPHLDTTARFMVMHGKTYGPLTEQDQEVLAGLHKGFKMFDMCEHSVSIPRPAEFVDRFAIVGPPEECIRRIREVIDLGIDRIVVTGPTVDVVESDTKLAADLMVREVLPVFSG